MKLLENKKGLIMGVANDRSIAWGIAQKLSDHGAELAFTYVGDPEVFSNNINGSVQCSNE